MAFSMNNRLWVFAILLAFISVFCFKSGKADEELPQIGEGGEYEPQPQAGQAGGFGVGPTQIITKALLCFGDSYIYQSCGESYRLDQSGDLHVPPEYTNEYCGGPCLKETNLVLKCLQGIFSNFVFYNKATISAIKDTIREGCSYGPERGNFDVAEHLQGERDSAPTIANRMVVSFVPIAMGWMFLL